jgi:DNA-binding NarL/FixJ family response regulator
MIQHIAPPDRSTARRLQELMRRERNVPHLGATGPSNTEIATSLVDEESTVKTHVRRNLAKLERRDRVQAVVLGHPTSVVRLGQGVTA